MTAPFVVMGLPRCRTAWLARFLSVPGRECVHEPSRFWRGMDDLYAALAAPGAAISDSCLTLRWAQIVTRFPSVRLVVVRRPVSAIMASARRLGMAHGGTEATLRVLDAACDELLERPEAAHVLADALDDGYVAANVFRHCHGYVMPDGQWELWRKRRVEVDAAQHMAEVAANSAGMSALFPEFTWGAA